MRRQFYIIVNLSFLILVISLLSCQSKDKVQIELEKVAEDLTKDCPIQQDPLTRLDRCEVLPNRTIKYSYTIFLEIESPDTISFKEKTKQVLLYKIQTNPAFDYMKNNNVTFLYMYADATGKSWANIEITPKDYNSAIIKPEESNLTNLNLYNGSKLERVQAIANDTQKTLPIKISTDSISIIECRAVSDTLEYVYKYENATISDFDISLAKSQIIETLKSTAAIEQEILREGIILKFIYLDKNKKYINTIVIDPIKEGLI